MYLDPGLAFGAGRHVTTWMCLEQLCSITLGGKSVIDYGCGSGVLAIAALKFEAHRAVGVDIDPRALQVRDANARLNHVAERYISCPQTNCRGRQRMYWWLIFWPTYSRIWPIL